MSGIENFNTEFLEFAKTQPADRIYYGTSPKECALAQFVNSKGFEKTCDQGYGKEEKYQYAYPIEAYDAAVCSNNHTWGGLVTRLESRLNQE